MPRDAFDGRTALVTGASGGLGGALAHELAKRGAKVVLTGRDEAALLAVRSKVGGAKVVPLDLADDGAPERLLARAGDVDVLVANAGVGLAAPLLDAPWERTRGMLRLNVESTTELVRLAARGMAARGGGRILLVASASAYAPIPGWSAYAASKAYVLSLGEALRAEVRDAGVRVTVLCPGPVETGFYASAGTPLPPLARLGTIAASRVARAGVAGLARGRGVVVPGLRVKLAVAAMRVAPRAWTARVARWLLR